MELYKRIYALFPSLEMLYDDDGIKAFKATPVSELYQYNLTLGLWIRNNYIHPAGSILKPLFAANGITQADDMSSLIVNLFHFYLHTK